MTSQDIPILLEVCVDTAQGLRAAIEGGADRIELCSALGMGGLTPSAGFMALAATSPVPAYPLLRPREGDFCYEPAEIDCLKRDIDQARAAGLPGVVIGANLANGALDETTLRTLAEHAAGLDLTLHRAFDLVPDMEEALEQAVALGVSRILTSGGAASALEGLDQIASLFERAGDRIIVMPGSGIRPGNADAFMSRLNLREIHASCGVARPPAAGKVRALGFETDSPRQTDAAMVRALKTQLTRT